MSETKRCLSGIRVPSTSGTGVNAYVQCQLPRCHDGVHSALLVETWPIKVEWPRRKHWRYAATGARS